MKVLFITLGNPDAPVVGPQIRDNQLYRRMAEKHDVRVIALVDTVPDKAVIQGALGQVHLLQIDTRLNLRLLFRLLGHLLSGRPLATLPFYQGTIAAEIQAMARQWQPDIIQIEHSFLAPYLDAIPEDSSAATVLSLHNVGELQYMRSAAIQDGWIQHRMGAMKAWSMKGWEARWCARFDRVITVSEDDRDFLLEEDPDLPIRIVGNGAETDQPMLESASGGDLLFVGNLKYPPNVDAVRFFCTEILPGIRRRFPSVQFVAVGLDPPADLLELAVIPGVKIVSGVKSVRPYYQNASVTVVPLRAGGGTRLKILEAFALGRPVVSTTLGCEGLSAQDGKHLLVANGAESIASAVIRLLEDSELAARISAQARALCEREYGWDRQARRLEAVHQECRSS